MLFDLHVHTRLSPCSSLSIDEILAHARQRGLDGVCITDHDTMDIRGQAREGVQADGLCLLFGMEYGTAEGDFLLFGPFEGLTPGLSAPELLRLVAGSGGVAIAAHPFRPQRPTREYLIRNALCRTVERINGRNPDQANRQVDAWLDRYPLHQCGGSDAHSLPELGKVATRFEVPIRTREELIRALQAGLCRPFLNQGQDLFALPA